MGLFGSAGGDDDVHRRVEELERRGAAIKVLRDETGLGLREATSIVDRLG